VSTQGRKRAVGELIRYLASHRYLRLGTVTPQGSPQVHTVGYVSVGPTVYFITGGGSRKIRNIRGNPAVAYAVDENYADWRDIRGIQMEGVAHEVESPLLIARIKALFLVRFPGSNEVPPDKDRVFVEIRPLKAFLLDNGKGFGHREEVQFEGYPGRAGARNTGRTGGWKIISNLWATRWR